jgi:hypothetical protein
MRSEQRAFRRQLRAEITRFATRRVVCEGTHKKTKSPLLRALFSNLGVPKAIARHSLRSCRRPSPVARAAARGVVARFALHRTRIYEGVLIPLDPAQ